MEVLPERVVTSAYVGLLGGVAEDSANIWFAFQVNQLLAKAWADGPAGVAAPLVLA